MSGKQGLERDSRLRTPRTGGPSPGGGDLVPESQSGGAQVGTAQELLEPKSSGVSSWQSPEGEEVTDGRGCSSQPPPARGSQDDLVYQCPRKGGDQGVEGGTGRAWGAVGDGTLRRSSSSPYPRDLIPTGAPPLSTHGNPP